MPKGDFIDPDVMPLVLIKDSPSFEDQGPLPMPIRAVEVDIEIVHESIERTAEYWALTGLRPRPKPTQMTYKELLMWQQIDKGGMDIMERAIELRERLMSLKAPKDARKKMA